MAYTDVSICNLALTHLGDKAAVVSISAPTTAQEQYCATYYPIARDLTLESHCWAFNTVRKALVTSSVTPPSTWQYAYDAPANMLRLLAIMDPNAADDYSAGVNFSNIGAYSQPVVNLGVPTPYDFVQEYDEAAAKIVIYTDLQSAVGRYTIQITDVTKYSNDFHHVAVLPARRVAGRSRSSRVTWARRWRRTWRAMANLWLQPRRRRRTPTSARSSPRRRAPGSSTADADRRDLTGRSPRARSRPSCSGAST
jgi:hypothetical protein